VNVIEPENFVLPASAGTYALILKCDCRASIGVGRLGSLKVEPGCYVYVGSAFGPGGLKARCGRHFRGGRPHWHIDYLRPLCRMEAIWFTADRLRREHHWAEVVGASRGASRPFPGFGASDCDCASHLFRFASAPSFDGFKRRAHRRFGNHAPIGRWINPVED